MKVLYDARVFSLCRFGGIAKYYAKLWRNLPQGVEPLLSILYSENVHLHECGFHFPVLKNKYQTLLSHINFRGKSRVCHFLGCVFPHLFQSSEMLNNQNFKRILCDGNYDLIHLTGIHGNEWVFKKSSEVKRPVVVTCFDLIPELFYGNKVVREEHSYAYAAATRIIAISENTKHDLCDFYNIPSGKVSVIPLGCDAGSKLVTESCVQTKGIKYVLYVGKRGGYKNFDFFARAIAPILEKDRSLKVYCTGAPFSTAEEALLERLGVKMSFVQQFVPDEKLPELYHNALAFVYPSLYEGFGLPILDAFANGCPTLLANATCFPEVGGDAALYFDPQDEADFRRQLMRVIGDDSQARGLRADMVARGKERVKLFSWKKCAEETAEVYRQCVSR